MRSGLLKHREGHATTLLQLVPLLISQTVAASLKSYFLTLLKMVITNKERERVKETHVGKRRIVYFAIVCLLLKTFQCRAKCSSTV